MIADHDPDVLLVLSADHVYKLDYSDVVAHHLDSGAAVTMVTTSVAKRRRRGTASFVSTEIDGSVNLSTSPMLQKAT